MSILRKINNKSIKVYFVVVTIIYLIESLTIQNPYFPILYAFLGPILFFGLHFKLSFKFSAYVEQNYPELMKKYAVNFSVMKGEYLDFLSIYQGKKDFEIYEDTLLMSYFEKGKLLLKLAIYSFIIYPLVLIISYLI
jgi:hypothetical protein